jgi:hypothetical protein
MTTPAQPGSGSSASGSTSTSASLQPAAIAKDSVTPGTSVTGLAGVLAEADAGEVAAGIARAVGAAVTEAAQGAQANIQEIRVIGDLSVLGDVTTLEIMTSQVAQLTGQVAEYVKAVPDAVASPPPRTGLKGEKIAEFLGVGDAANALGSLAGTITQLVAGTYTYSGQAMPNASVGGLDILTARALANGITAFVSAAVTAPTAGGPAPVTRAAHGELLSKDGTVLLYAQVIAAGDDQVLRQTLIRNTWSNLTGLTAEYALLMPGHEALTFGLESAFAVAHGSVRKGLTDIARKKVTLRAEAE